MQISRPVGRGAQARKYDILTALGAYALSLSPNEQRRVLRLMTLITARYNWQRNELATGQREIARLWACTERTVKRDIACLKARGWFVVKRQGVRGSVSIYALDIDRILDDTSASWPQIGPDFEFRMRDEKDTDSSNVVPLPVRGAVVAPEAGQGDEWDIARLALHAADPGLYTAWIHALSRDSRAGGRLVLRAPSRFHASYVTTHLASRLLCACQKIDPEIATIDIIA